MTEPPSNNIGRQIREVGAAWSTAAAPVIREAMAKLTRSFARSTKPADRSRAERGRPLGMHAPGEPHHYTCWASFD